jgi:two-component system, OmpR family, sensor histidine kinase ResE
MAERERTRRRPSVRLWQTELFIVVIVVAILILSSSLTQGLQRTLKQMGERQQLKNASALASQISAEFPLTVESRARLREQVRKFRVIYGDNIWVYDRDGTLIDSVHNQSPPTAVLREARLAGLADSPPYANMTLKPGGFSVAGKAIYDPDERRTGSVVLAQPVDTSLAVLNAVRSRLWVAFWVSLIVAGLLGVGFSEFIGRRVRMMSKAATAIAAGDFDQRLPTGLVPDEVYELAVAYNQMAVKLGEAFSAVHEREQEIAAVVESMAEGVVAFDAEGTVRVVNPEAGRLLEVDTSESVGAMAETLCGEEHCLDAVHRGLRGEAVSGIATFGDRTVLLHCTPIPGEDEPQGAVLILSDVTEQKRLEEAQRRFVANASHEMRTPIAALKGLLELLTGGAKDDPRILDDFLKTAQLEVDRLGRLVEDMLTLAQLEAGTVVLHQEALPVAEMLGEVAAVMHPLAERGEVVLAVSLPDGDVDVVCDRHRIVQVLLGFVDNALKHTARGGHVTLTAEMRDDRVAISVADDGVGIEPEVIPRLFDRFYRADEARAQPKGTGLGLAIAKEIIEAHGGTITIESEPGHGATFAFELLKA